MSSSMMIGWPPVLPSAPAADASADFGRAAGELVPMGLVEPRERRKSKSKKQRNGNDFTQRYFEYFSPRGLAVALQGGLRSTSRCSCCLPTGSAARV